MLRNVQDYFTRLKKGGVFGGINCFLYFRDVGKSRESAAPFTVGAGLFDKGYS